jgi:C4-dicarboxylate transporter DctQ subunit
MAGATLIIFLSILHRYATGVSFLYPYVYGIDFSWSQELCIIMFVWMAKFGAAYGVRTGIHVGVDVMINRLRPELRSKFIVFGLLAGAMFTGTVSALGAHFVWNIGAHYAFFHALGIADPSLFEGPVTPDLEWPAWAVYSAIPLGSGLMCLRFLQVCWKFLRTGELPHHDESHVAGLDDNTAGAIAHVPADVNWYEMDDNLHAKDIAHHEGAGRKSEPEQGGK